MDIGEGFSSTSRPPSAGLEGLRQIGKLPPVDGRRAAAKLTVSIRELLGTGVALRTAISADGKRLHVGTARTFRWREWPEATSHGRSLRPIPSAGSDARSSLARLWKGDSFVGLVVP